MQICCCSKSGRLTEVQLSALHRCFRLKQRLLSDTSKVQIIRNTVVMMDVFASAVVMPLHQLCIVLHISFHLCKLKKCGSNPQFQLWICCYGAHSCWRIRLVILLYCRLNYQSFFQEEPSSLPCFSRNKALVFSTKRISYKEMERSVSFMLERLLSSVKSFSGSFYRKTPPSQFHYHAGLPLMCHI